MVTMHCQNLAFLRYQKCAGMWFILFGGGLGRTKIFLTKFSVKILEQELLKMRYVGYQSIRLFVQISKI
jgi:hypothetical protein